MSKLPRYGAAGSDFYSMPDNPIGARPPVDSSPPTKTTKTPGPLVRASRMAWRSVSIWGWAKGLCIAIGAAMLKHYFTGQVFTWDLLLFTAASAALFYVANVLWNLAMVPRKLSNEII